MFYDIIIQNSRVVTFWCLYSGGRSTTMLWKDFNPQNDYCGTFRLQQTDKSEFTFELYKNELYFYSDDNSEIKHYIVGDFDSQKEKLETLIRIVYGVEME